MRMDRTKLIVAIGALLLGFVPMLVGAGADAASEDEKSDDDESTGPVPLLPWDRPKQGEEQCFVEEITMLRDLRQRSLELDRREAILGEREAALESLEAEGAKRLGDLDGLRTEILELMDREQVATADRVRTLAKVVDTMKPREAAILLAGMDDGVAVLLLRKLKPKQAGKILGAMPTDVSQRLGDRMTVLEDPRDASADAGGR